MVSTICDLRLVQGFGLFATRIGLTLVYSLILTSGAMAQPSEMLKEFDSPGLVVEAMAGWGGYVDRSTPVPMSFLFRNDTARNIEGVLTLIEPWSHREVNLGEMIVSPGTTRRLTFVCSMTDWSECIGKLSYGRKTLWRRSLDLNTGKSFNSNVNYVLFVDASGRKLELPSAVAEVAPTNMHEPQVAGKQGRPINCITLKSWQVSNHPGPLIVAQAMIFPEGASERDLNQVQWKAVAEWMCQGGTVFVHKASQEIISRLMEMAPLGSDVAMESGPFAIRQIGLGALYEFDRPLMSSESAEIRQSIATIAANLSRNQINTFSDQTYVRQSRRGQADRNRNMILGLFGLYTLLTGGGALLLFRLSQRKIAIFTIIMVTLASVLAGVLGGFLRFSKGDLHWMTVTQVGTGGMVQVGGIEVQSAGSRNTQVAIRGEHADLQFIGNPRFNGNYFDFVPSRQFGYSPFTWQPNQDASEKDLFQVNVPMSPWGRRRCHATAYRRDMKRLDFDLDFKPNVSANKQGRERGQNEPVELPGGTFSLNINNPLPFEIYDCRLVIGVSVAETNQIKASRRSRNPYDPNQKTASAVDNLVDVYHFEQLSGVLSSKPLEFHFPANFRLMQSYWEMHQMIPNGSQLMFRVSRMGTANAWIVGRVKNSPAIEIDEDRSDFLPQEGTHFFVQELRPEEMPNVVQFAKSQIVTDSEKVQPAER